MVATCIDQIISASALETHIYSTLQPAYASRYHKMMSAVTKYLLPLGLTMPQPNRDVIFVYFVLLTLQEPLDATAISKKAVEEEDLVIAAGPLFQVQGDTSGQQGAFERDFRLSFAWEDEDKLEVGIVRLSRVIIRSL